MKKMIALLAVFTLLLGGNAWAQTAAKTDGAKTDSEISEGLSKAMEKAKQEQEKEEAAKAPAAEKAAPAPAPEKKDTGFLSSLGSHIDFYGFLRLDVSYDTSRVEYGNWALWVHPNKNFTRYENDANGNPVAVGRVNTQNDGTISISPRLTRFGFNFKGIKIDTIKANIGGKLEFDFYGGTAYKVADWKAVPRWRQAYLTLDWPDWAEILAGQASDVFSPMFPRIDYNGGSWCLGNVGARRPQFRVTFKPILAEGHRLYIQAAIARPGSVDGNDYDMTDVVDNGTVTPTLTPNGKNDGEDSAIPMVQWRVAYSGKLWTDKPFTIGASGHWEQYEMHYLKYNPADGLHYDKSFSYEGYSFNAELSLPILDWWSLNGEFFYGKNLKDIFGGSFQAINTEALVDPTNPRIEGVKGMGFWVDTTIQPWSLWALTLGYMADMPDDSTLPSKSYAKVEATRFGSSAIYVNNEFNLGGGFQIGLEFMHMTTTYRYQPNLSVASFKEYDATDERIRTYFMYKF